METKDQPVDAQARFPVVGLGASAGGLEALKSFFEAMPANTGISFVVVQHLASNQESILHEIIQRLTKIRVSRIEDDQLVEPNQIYVLPSGYDVNLRNNHLYLTTMVHHQGWPETINRFFNSLALERGTLAAVIILSGVGHDGTDGARAIKAHGGLIIAQDLESAIQESMPFNIIDAGLASAVLSPDMMPEYLLSHFDIDLQAPRISEDLKELITDQNLNQIVEQIRLKTGYNFADYKVSTIRRQVARRMAVSHVNNVNAYINMLKTLPDEAHNLVNGMLIHVTNFFRDPAAFESLKKNALLPLLKTLSIDDVFRVWVPGCASGEEAVSIAIMIYECLRELDMPEMQVRIFATDVSRALIQRARRGVYPPSIAENVTSERLRDHFMNNSEGYQSRTHINRMIVWAEHNLTEHPPFSSLHLISCRNVLIYFQPKLQERIRALFQFALLPDGILFLGSSEAIPDIPNHFIAVDSKNKIYRRAYTTSRQWMRLDKPLFTKIAIPSEELIMAQKSSQGSGGNDHNLQLIKELLLAHYNSTCVIVDERYQIHYTYGEIDRYLRLISGGDSPRNILSMAREGLDSELTIALYEAFDENKTVVRQGVWVNNNGDERLINLIVKPISDSHPENRFKLVIFELTKAGQNLKNQDSETASNSDGGATINRLREELQQARQALQSATQALQAKSEELSSSMEEISSANEEVQTTNEELRTSKEELESMNEELNTLNTQLSSQNNELTHANNALYNFLQSTEIGVIFLDQSLSIREYTQAATGIFSLRKSDIGRPLSEVTSQLKYDKLVEDATQVLDTLANTDKEVVTEAGNWYRMSIRPYRTKSNLIDGLVLTFNDITVLKEAHDDAEKRSLYVRNVIDSIQECIVELDSGLKVIDANTRYLDLVKTDLASIVGRFFYETGADNWDSTELRRLLAEILPKRTVIEDYLMPYTVPESGSIMLRINARQIQEADRILLVITALPPKPSP